MDLHTRRGGDGTGERGTVVFIHGFPFDGSLWELQLEGLPAGWIGLAPDLRGFGRSPMGGRDELVGGSRVGGRIARRDEPVLTMDRLADDVADVVATVGGGPVVVCGLSMGGYVAFSLWRRHPGLVRALVLADTRAEADSDEGRENRMRMAQIARDSGPGAIAAAMLPSLLSDRTLDQRPEVALRVREMMTGTSAETLVAALAGMAARRDSVSDLPGMDVPAMVLVGEEDRLTPPDAARAMAQRLPRARLEVIPGTGHVSNLEDPAAFNALLAGFLDSIETA
jgi:3-oxoadipate enol-lactonase